MDGGINTAILTLESVGAEFRKAGAALKRRPPAERASAGSARYMLLCQRCLLILGLRWAITDSVRAALLPSVLCDLDSFADEAVAALSDLRRGEGVSALAERFLQTEDSEVDRFTAYLAALRPRLEEGADGEAIRDGHAPTGSDSARP
jgi:hypothetical protein